MKKKNENYLVKRLQKQEGERKKFALRVLTNIDEMNKKQKAWVTQCIRKGKRR